MEKYQMMPAVAASGTPPANHLTPSPPPPMPERPPAAIYEMHQHQQPVIYMPELLGSDAPQRTELAGPLPTDNVSLPATNSHDPAPLPVAPPGQSPPGSYGVTPQPGTPTAAHAESQPSLQSYGTPGTGAQSQQEMDALMQQQALLQQRRQRLMQLDEIDREEEAIRSRMSQLR